MKRKITVYDPDNDGVRRAINYIIEGINMAFYKSIKEVYAYYGGHVNPSKYNIEINITKVK